MTVAEKTGACPHGMRDGVCGECNSLVGRQRARIMELRHALEDVLRAGVQGYAPARARAYEELRKDDPQ